MDLVRNERPPELSPLPEAMATLPPVSSPFPPPMFTLEPSPTTESPGRMLMLPDFPVIPSPVLRKIAPEFFIPLEVDTFIAPESSTEASPLKILMSPLVALNLLETDTSPDTRSAPVSSFEFIPTSNLCLCALNAAIKSRVIACLSTSWKSSMKNPSSSNDIGPTCTFSGNTSLICCAITPRTSMSSMPRTANHSGVYRYFFISSLLMRCIMSS